jgi:EpsI family protein
MLAFLRKPFPCALSILLLGEAALFYAYPKRELVPVMPPMQEAPRSAGGWRVTHEFPIETEVQELLKADDTLSRAYASPEGGNVSLFIALFKSQRAGVAPHSPKVCLPGSGWVPSESSTVALALAGWPEPVPANRYVVSRGENRSLVLYWYQSAARVVANEYAAKLYTVLDGLRYRRSDTSLVRVIVPLGADGTEAAQAQALQFLQAVYPGLRPYLPHL